MAEIKVDQRQIAQPNAPDLSGAGSAHGVFGKVVQRVAEDVGTVVDHYNKLEANAQYTQTLNTLNKDLANALSTENIAQGDAYARYIASAEATIQGGMEYTPRRYRKELSQDLRDKVNNLGLTLAKADLSFQESKRKAEGQAIIATHLQELNDAVESGDTGAIARHRDIVEGTISDLKSVGAFDALDEFKLKSTIDKTIARADYQSKFNRLLREDPVEADKFLRTFVETKPANLTHEEWGDVQAGLLQARGNYYKAVDAAETLGLDEFQLAFSSGQIKNGSDIDNFVAAKEAEGRYFSYNDRLKMQNMLIKSMKEESKDAETLLAIDNDILTNPDNLYTYKPADLLKYYQQKSGFLIDQFAKQKEANPDINVPSPLAIKASVASKLPLPISAFNQEFSDKLQYGTVEDFEESLTVGSQLSKASPKTFSNLPKDTQAYQEHASQLRGNTTLAPENIKTATDKAINEKDSATKDRLDKELTQIRKTPWVKDLYKDIYGTKFVNPALQPQYNNVDKTFEAFFRASGDKVTAAKLTKNFMRTRSGPSKYVPKNDITKDPIEETQLYQEHPTLVKNQMALAAYEVVQNHKEMAKKGYKVSPTVEWPDGVDAPDLGSLTEKELYEKAIFKPSAKSKKGLFGEKKELPPTLKINGKNRKLFFMNPNSDIEDPSVDQREIWYEDEFGLAQPLYVIQENQYANNILKYDTGIPSVQFQSAAKITPQMAAIKEQRKFEDEATQHLREEFRGQQKVAQQEEMKRNRQLQKEGKLPIDINRRPNPMDQVDAIKKQLAIEKEEATYIKENLKNKAKELSEAKKRKIDELIAGSK